MGIQVLEFSPVFSPICVCRVFFPPVGLFCQRSLSAEAAKEPKLSPEEKNAKKVAAVNAAKEHGKELFAQGNYQEAFLLFERAVLIISGMSNLEVRRKEEITSNQNGTSICDCDGRHFFSLS